MHPRRFTLTNTALLSASALALCIGIAWGMPHSASTLKTAHAFPDPTLTLPTPQAEQSIVLAGGCFWGMEAVFEHLNGVTNVVSGYAGGSVVNPQYETVSSGQTGHAESVKITYNPSKISIGQILKVFFSVAHDPTQVDQQGPDSGSQYRSAIFFSNPSQKQFAQAYIQQLNAAKVFIAPIATQLSPLGQFFPAEEYHQHFIDRNPNYPYVVINDLPKLKLLSQTFPNLYKP